MAFQTAYAAIHTSLASSAYSAILLFTGEKIMPEFLIKSEFWKKLGILEKTRNFGKKVGILEKSRNFKKKSEF